MAVNIHITIIELNALHTKRQNLFQELDAVIHLLMEAKHWGLRSEERFSRNAETDIVCRHLLEKKTRYMHKIRRLLTNRRILLLELPLFWKTPIFPTNIRSPSVCHKCSIMLTRRRILLP